MNARLPLLLAGGDLRRQLDDPSVAVVDLSRPETHRRLHLPGARFIDYAQIVAARPPATGAMPAPGRLEQVLGAAGISDTTHVVAYDDEGGGKAARLLWTLAVLGHRGGYSLLDGGLHAWAGDRLPLTDEVTQVTPQSYAATGLRDEHVADSDYILARLHDPATVMLDARSADEYTGHRRYAMRGGHIPGAIHLEWTWAMDQARNLRLKEEHALRAELARAGVVPGKEVITYCQSHHRSAYSWFVLHCLGVAARGYPGSWSEWGNTPELPVETGAMDAARDASSH